MASAAKRFKNPDLVAMKADQNDRQAAQREGDLQSLQTSFYGWHGSPDCTVAADTGWNRLRHAISVANGVGR